ncbi:MAG: hypothetical protein KF900_13985 [Bacteroidetes bacterium]|nr:hypothetical protein [Bacteroidota bacterium]
MSSINDISEKIRANNLLFDISVNGRVLSKKNRASDVEAMHGSLEQYFEKILAANKATRLEGAFFSQNGSSFKNRGFFSAETKAVALGATMATKTVAPATENVALATKPVAPPAESQIKHEHMNFATKADIEAAQLKTEVHYLKDKVTDLADRNKKLETERDDLRTAHNKLQTDFNTLEKAKDLELQKQLLDKDKEQKSGLGGVVEGLNSINTDTVNAIFNGIAVLKTGKTETNELPPGPKHTNAEAQKNIEALTNILMQQPAEAVEKIVLNSIVFASDTGKLNKVHAALYPQQAKQQAAPTNLMGAENELNELENFENF